MLVIAFALASSETVKANPVKEVPMPRPRPIRAGTSLNSMNNNDMDKSETYWYGYQPRFYNFMNPLYNNDFYYRGFNQYNPYSFMPPYYSNPYPYYF